MDDLKLYVDTENRVITHFPANLRWLMPHIHLNNYCDQSTAICYCPCSQYSSFEDFVTSVMSVELEPRYNPSFYNEEGQFQPHKLLDPRKRLVSPTADDVLETVFSEIHISINHDIRWVENSLQSISETDLLDQDLEEEECQWIHEHADHPLSSVIFPGMPKTFEIASVVYNDGNTKYVLCKTHQYYILCFWQGS
eukprot:gnl/Dysnectes_brevis/9396_a17416_243.p1 GENE.gnl/Dysnectes_brevis/9396_a17416_243~~gnl/Dysnectes_brevis/9396_a17416_243.p1  ORF type:complete len:195 (-),score=0.33 gnl/Dysnectes_brevis/9396_a17416_243:44-628(-)